MATTPVFLPGESHGQWSLAGPCGRKESDMTEQLILLLSRRSQRSRRPLPFPSLFHTTLCLERDGSYLFMAVLGKL